MSGITDDQAVLIKTAIKDHIMNEKDKFMVAVSNAYDYKDKGTLVGFEVVNKNN